jgi:tetratricopeptide (TPR) repeat protein
MNKSVIRNPQSKGGFMQRFFYLMILLLVILGSAFAQAKLSAKDCFNQSYSKYKGGDLDRAIADCDKAITLRPNHAEAHINRGLTRILQGKEQEANQDFKKSLELKPDLKPSLVQMFEKIKWMQKPQS